MCISVLVPFSSPCSSLVIFLSIQHFRCFLVALFSSKIVRFLWHLLVGMFSCHSLPIVDRIFFRCFAKSCFVSIILTFVDYYYNYHYYYYCCCCCCYNNNQLTDDRIHRRTPAEFLDPSNKCCERDTKLTDVVVTHQNV